MFGVFGSSETFSLTDVCQFNPAWFCETSSELNIICQCQCESAAWRATVKMADLVVVQHVSAAPRCKSSERLLIRYNEVNEDHNKLVI